MFKFINKNILKLFSAFMIFGILLVIMCFFAFDFIETPCADSLVGFSTVSFANMMVIGSVKDVSDKYTSGENIAYKVYIIDINQVDQTVPFPKPNSSREVGSIPMKNGEYMQYFESHTNPTYIGTGEKGDISSSGTNNLELLMAGVRDALMAFAEEHIGGKFILIFHEIESDQFEILGSVDRPVILKSFENKNDKDGRYVSFKFERSSVNQYYHYIGVIVTLPATVHTAGSATLALTSAQNLYSVPDGSSTTYALTAVSGLTANDKGRVITLHGTGSDKAATIAENSCFILEDGATWTAKAGSSITFRILDASTLIEVQGSRIQTA